MPGGLGKDLKICFFGANQEEENIARENGADIIGDKTILKEFDDEIISFDKLYCSVGAIKELKKYARFLGPKGLFPNSKVQTLLEIQDIGGLTS